MTLTDYMYYEKKEEEDLPALKTLLTHRNKGSKITYKSAEKNRFPYLPTPPLGQDMTQGQFF